MLRDLFSLFPAHAGVILCDVVALVIFGTFPRTRGGDPIWAVEDTTLILLFPAHAGVIPFPIRFVKGHLSFPRTRGGDPKANVTTARIKIFSPHTRG